MTESSRNFTDGSTVVNLWLCRGAPGDLVAATGLLRDLHAQYPGVRTSLAGGGAAELLAHDGRVSAPDPAGPTVRLDYKALVDRSRTDRAARYLYAAHEAFEAQTRRAVRRGPPRPSLVLSVGEEGARPYPEPYCLLASGTKVDIPLKAAPHRTFCEVVARTPGWNWVQVGAVMDARHMHRQVAVPGATNLLGKTSLRRLLQLVRHASAVLCLTSLPMLLASAFGVPCVALGGGREDPWLFEGLGVTYLHTVGAGLACCARHGCRASVALPPHAQSDFPAGFVCADPAPDRHAGAVGRCMTHHTPDQILAALERSKRGAVGLTS